VLGRLATGSIGVGLARSASWRTSSESLLVRAIGKITTPVTAHRPRQTRTFAEPGYSIAGRVQIVVAWVTISAALPGRVAMPGPRRGTVLVTGAGRRRSMGAGRSVFGAVHDGELIACCGPAKRVAAAAGEGSAAAGSACGGVAFGAPGTACEAR